MQTKSAGPHTGLRVTVRLCSNYSEMTIARSRSSPPARISINGRAGGTPVKSIRCIRICDLIRDSRRWPRRRANSAPSNVPSSKRCVAKARSRLVARHLPVNSRRRARANYRRKPARSLSLQDGCAEVLHPVDLPALSADGETGPDALEPRIHDVRAMARAGQPAGNDFLGRLGTVRDVLAREARLVTGADHPVLWLTTIAAAMLEEFLAGHVARVTGSGQVQLLRNTE